jgi:hypothetical protein
MNDPKVAELYDELMKLVQDTKLKVQKVVLGTPMKKLEGTIEWATFNRKKQKPALRVMGVAG